MLWNPHFHAGVQQVSSQLKSEHYNQVPPGMSLIRRQDRHTILAQCEDRHTILAQCEVSIYDSVRMRKSKLEVAGSFLLTCLLRDKASVC